MLGDQGATLISQTSPDNYIIQAKPNIIFAKAGIQPREPQPLDNGGYQTAQHSWVQMTHFTRPWSQHMRARESTYGYTHDPKGPVPPQGCSNPPGDRGEHRGVVGRIDEGNDTAEG